MRIIFPAEQKCILFLFYVWRNIFLFSYCTILIGLIGSCTNILISSTRSLSFFFFFRDLVWPNSTPVELRPYSCEFFCLLFPYRFSGLADIRFTVANFIKFAHFHTTIFFSTLMTFTEKWMTCFHFYLCITVMKGGSILPTQFYVGSNPDLTCQLKHRFPVSWSVNKYPG